MRGRRKVFGWLGLLLCAAGLRAVEGFESGLGDWTPSGLWHRSSGGCLTAHEGSYYVYLGREGACNYADGRVKDDTLRSGPQTLTVPARAYISFWLLYEVESVNPSCFDQLRLERSYDGNTWALLKSFAPGADPGGGGPALGWASGSGLGGTPLWTFQRVDLSAFLGLTLYLRFRFISGASQAGSTTCWPADADLDGYRGVAIDEIRFNEDPPVLELNKSVAPAFASPGATFTYSVVARNVDAAPATLTVWDSLPAGSIFVDADNGGVLDAGRVLWNLGGVPAGGAVTLTVRVRSDSAAPVPQDWLNSAEASSSAGPGSVRSAPVPALLRAPGLSLAHSVSPTTIISGDRATWNLVVSNYDSVTHSALSLALSLPVGLVYDGAYPSLSASYRWDFSLAPGQVRAFSLWGRGFGEDGAVLTMGGSLREAAVPVASRNASVTVKKPIEPIVRLLAVYPNPAPSDRPGLPQSAFVYYETNLAMPMLLDIYTIAGEKVRSLRGPAFSGKQQIEWDLKNEWGAPVASGLYAFRLWSSLPVLPTPEAFGFIAVLR